MFSIIPCLCLLDAMTRLHPPACDDQKCLQTPPKSTWGMKSLIVENHRSKGVVKNKQQQKTTGFAPVNWGRVKTLALYDRLGSPSQDYPAQNVNSTEVERPALEVSRNSYL